jgi:hypothetical protein
MSVWSRIRRHSDSAEKPQQVVPVGHFSSPTGYSAAITGSIQVTHKRRPSASQLPVATVDEPPSPSKSPTTLPISNSALAFALKDLNISDQKDFVVSFALTVLII